MLKFVFRSLLLLALAAPAFLHAASVHDPAASRKLEKILSPLSSLHANFSQTLTDGEGYELQSVTGTMTVARPGKVYWKTAPPFEQLVVSDATTLWLYDQDLEQVTVRPFNEDIAETPAVLLIGRVENLEQKYRVSNVLEGKDTVYTLVPLNDSALYQKITLAFRGETPRAMSLWDTLGQRTRIEFTDVAVNKPIDDSLFAFVIPEGVDVLHDH